MSTTTAQKNSILNTVKLYFFPSIVTVISMMIWRDLSELRSDVKSLLAQSNIDKTRIDNLERDVRFLEQRVLGGIKPITQTTSIYYHHDRLFKHEEFYDVKKNLIKT
jgi:hypothetical protein